MLFLARTHLLSPWHPHMPFLIENLKKNGSVPETKQFWKCQKDQPFQHFESFPPGFTKLIQSFQFFWNSVCQQTHWLWKHLSISKCSSAFLLWGACWATSTPVNQNISPSQQHPPSHIPYLHQEGICFCKWMVKPSVLEWDSIRLP